MPSISIIGCGYIGFPLAREFVQDGWLVRGSTTTPAKLHSLRTAGVDAFLFDVSTAVAASDGLSSNDANDVAPLLESDVVVVNIPPGRGDALRREAYPSWIRYLARSVQPGASVVFVSSTSVYPNVSRVVSTPDASAEAGGSAGALLEAETTMLSRSLPGSVVRFGGLYGYERKPGRFFAGRMEIPSGRAPVNMIHRDDAVGILRHLVTERTGEIVINACAPIHPSRSEFYRTWAARAGFEPPSFIDELGPYKIVESDAQERVGYAFVYPDPLQPAP
jgi:nucleoside-diphosphate-sugar epimerase